MGSVVDPDYFYFIYDASSFKLKKMFKIAKVPTYQFSGTDYRYNASKIERFHYVLNLLEAG
jgi:hypothetical protein